MKYDYSILQSGDLVLVKSNSTIGALIAKCFYRESPLPWLMRRKYLWFFQEEANTPNNHTGIYCDGSNSSIVESLFSGTVETPIQDYIEFVKKGKVELIFARIVPPLTPPEKQEMEIFLVNALGTKYDYLSYVSHLWRLVLRLPPLKQIHSISEYWCTELASVVYRWIKRDIFGTWPTPYTLEKRITELKLEIVAHWHK